MQTSTSPLPLSAGPAVVLHAAGSRAGGELVCALFFSDGVLTLGRGLPSAGGRSASFPWSLAAGWEPVCLALSCDCRVLAACSAAGDLFQQGSRCKSVGREGIY
jgi:hypothetical protein